MADEAKVARAKLEGPSVKLDWSRLLGFDQAGHGADETGASRLNDPRLTKIGVKVGGKLGRKPPVSRN